jgi:serine/threonine protein kinase/Tfp pilus assembly protein PilF
MTDPSSPHSRAEALPDTLTTPQASPADEFATPQPASGDTAGLENAFPLGERPAAAQWLEGLPDRLPARFGRYTLHKLLGKGGMGAVYLAHDTQLDRPVALKIPRFGANSGPKAQERFLREARAAAMLSHPNLCPVYDAGQIEGVSYLVMGYVDGQSLAELLRDDPRRPIQGSVRLVGQLALAMQEAHRRGVIHRDLKPDNVMIDSQGQPVIMDFGLARRAPETGDVRLTESGLIMGTPAYMSPEQVKGAVTAMGPACDIYSLGVILYELLTGRLPFTGGLGELMAQIVFRPPPPPSQFRPDIDAELDVICLKALEKEPALRFGSMLEFANALERYSLGTPQGSSPTESPMPAATATPARAQHFGRSEQQPEEQRRWRVPQDPEAHSLYLKARHHWNKRTEDGLRNSIAFFNQALDREPTFALAWAGLADAYHQLAHWGLAPPRTACPRAKSAALKAIELDESLTEAHLALAVILKDYDWDFSEAERVFRRALQQSPEHASGHQWYGQCLACMGRHTEAIAELRRAQVLDSVALIHDAILGRHGYFYARQYDRAQEQLHLTVLTDPTFWIAQSFLGWVYLFQGDVAAGLDAIRKAQELADNPENLVGLGYGHALAGEPAKAQACIDALAALAPQRYVAAINIALIFTGMGDKDQAFAWLDRACDDHCQWLSEIRVDPAFDPLRSDPRFAALLERMNIKLQPE